ncbi:hypothetical protein P4O66_008788 [Electrophorus voltai]|uniref:Uncharacterized protein n=1 Tax=Electrophorus voltai TaxID=2609070 RepID=A0AAD8ZE79_9TELE|nr:hypothetical protein P4O66_008788 [Electrophorus voltai]
MRTHVCLSWCHGNKGNCWKSSTRRVLDHMLLIPEQLVEVGMPCPSAGHLEQTGLSERQQGHQTQVILFDKNLRSLWWSCYGWHGPSDYPRYCWHRPSVLLAPPLSTAGAAPLITLGTAGTAPRYCWHRPSVLLAPPLSTAGAAPPDHPRYCWRRPSVLLAPPLSTAGAAPLITLGTAGAAPRYCWRRPSVLLAPPPQYCWRRPSDHPRYCWRRPSVLLAPPLSTAGTAPLITLGTAGAAPRYCWHRPSVLLAPPL